ncbi:type III-B CRISPR module RAMP protein Cmr4 [Desulfotomaculum copahuensis]|uniref:Type III-B CRISPR module RAMP protein Cmr4 n=1 Tax=Desulfotomaculum copahuensis TaxID=1838280 RepID=A0A1B7LAS0_9FIRM|nr:type III-B CRISPR module RAMP protein Cmr4 [Desulfotomaculum copahuensis]OAT79301.1 type III-B CRISPR module RAMP protein Cmr4 [Desulfotomaculum copahuensis]
MTNYEKFYHAGLAVDPIHVGTGGSQLGRVDNTIVRDPVTRIPKIPGSSLAGVTRAYAAMAKGKYPDCAGQGQTRSDGSGGHCGKHDCPICTVFGFARGRQGGFAGLAAFSDMHVLLFPVATREGPVWVTAPIALRQLDFIKDLPELPDVDAIYLSSSSFKSQMLNLGWLLLGVKKDGWDGFNSVTEALKVLIPEYIKSRVVVISDKLFHHVVNSNLEVRTSVAINPVTGAADDGALFTYEALPRGTVLYWEVTCRNPAHFRIGGKEIIYGTKKATTDDVHGVVETAHPYLEHLGIGGMGTRGMGRLRVWNGKNSVNQPGDRKSQVGGDTNAGEH